MEGRDGGDGGDGCYGGGWKAERDAGWGRGWRCAGVEGFHEGDVGFGAGGSG